MTPADRLRLAADALEAAYRDASPAPWTYFEDHGRDQTDEGWSEVGVLDADGKRVALTHPTGEENDQPEHNAALAVMLAAATPMLIVTMRQAQYDYEAHQQPRSEPLHDPPVTGDFFTGPDGVTRLYTAGEWQPLATTSTLYSQPLLDLADAVLSVGQQ